MFYNSTVGLEIIDDTDEGEFSNHMGSNVKLAWFSDSGTKTALAFSGPGVDNDWKPTGDMHTGSFKNFRDISPANEWLVRI